MIIRGGGELLVRNLKRQLSNYWENIDFETIESEIFHTLDMIEKVLNHISKQNRYVWSDDNVVFSPMHSVQYSLFLYKLSRNIYLYKGACIEADAVYYLNKIMHGIDIYYAVEMPDVFFAEHPLGSVMGKAEYGDRFYFYQNCTVGGNIDSNGVLFYPIIGENVRMYSNSSILGNCNIGNNVIIASNTKILNQDIPNNSIVFGQSPNICIKTKTSEEIKFRSQDIWNF